MSPLKWILLVCFLISVYWLWPLYLLIAFIVICAVFDTGKRTKHKKFTYKFKPRKKVVYKAPRYKKPKPYKKGRLLKSGILQHYRHGRWTPKATKIDEGVLYLRSKFFTQQFFLVG